MKICKYRTNEPSVAAWGWRMMLGPASLLDGVVEILSLSFYGVGAKLLVSKRLAWARMVAIGKNQNA